jgi:hypothetical protein
MTLIYSRILTLDERVPGTNEGTMWMWHPFTYLFKVYSDGRESRPAQR